jgi:hypothetical protein
MQWTLYTVVEDHLDASVSHPLVCLGLDHNFDVGCQHHYQHRHRLPIPPYTFSSSTLVPSYSQSLFVSARGPGISPSAIPASSSTCFYSTPEAKEALGRDEGHETASRPEQARSEDESREEVLGSKRQTRCGWRRGETPSVPPSSSSEELVASSPMDEKKEERDKKGNRGEYEDEPTLGQKDGMDMRNREPRAW